MRIRWLHIFILSVAAAAVAALPGCFPPPLVRGDGEEDTAGAAQDAERVEVAAFDTDPAENWPLRDGVLSPGGDCAALLERFAARAADRLRTTIEEARWRLLTKVDWGCEDRRPIEICIDGDADADSPGNMLDVDPDTFTDTNTQVTGVDEADFIKTDGRFIYWAKEDALRIFVRNTDGTLGEVSRVPVRGTARSLYVNGGHAVVYSSLGVLTAGNGFAEVEDLTSGDYGFVEDTCTYGYDCDFRGDGRGLQMTVVDLTDPFSPQVVRETEFSGSYLASRRVGDIVRTVLVFPEPVAVPGIPIVPEVLAPYVSRCWEDPADVPFSAELVNFAFDELLTDLNVRVADAIARNPDYFLPRMRDVLRGPGAADEAVSVIASCDEILLSDTPDAGGFVALVSMDMGSFDDFDDTMYLGSPGAVFANGSNLYVATRVSRWQYAEDWYFEEGDENRDATVIHSFGLDPGSTQSWYRASGVVKGHLLNQFSMDEHGGVLRVATTIGQAWQEFANSRISVLSQEGQRLSTVGLIGNIAPTEDIRSVRFDGDRAFVVTFKKTDPLFVFDLSKPTAPALEGELHIDGFSTYLHKMDEDHLLTIGYDAQDEGTFAWFQGIQLQVIDVSDMAAPRLLHKEIIGTRGSTSEAATNHLAFTYFPSRDLLALPMVVCEDSEGGASYGGQMTFNGLFVYDVTREDGFSLRGGVPYLAPEVEFSASSLCTSWWTDSNSSVKRSLFIENTVYAVAEDRIIVSDVDAVSSPIQVVSLEP